MELNRRNFLKASSAVAGAVGLASTGLWKLHEALGAENGTPPIIWLQGQNCTGCSVSLLNTIYYTTIDNLLTTVVDLDYHSTVMAAAGDQAVAAATATRAKGGFVLVVEGAIPTGASGKYCEIWPGMTILQAVQDFAAKAAFIVAVGTCASYGGMAAGKPNPTGAKGLSAVLPGKTVVNLPGCPVHPDWIVGTVAYLLQNGKAPALDANGRPTQYYGIPVHNMCPRLTAYQAGSFATRIGDPTNCMHDRGCRGWKTGSDCPSRKWNSGAAGTPGVNWCLGSNAPCLGCTQPDFPDGSAPFYYLDSKMPAASGTGTGTGATPGSTGTTGTGGTTGGTGTTTGATGTTTTTTGGTTGGTTSGGGEIDD